MLTFKTDDKVRLGLRGALVFFLAFSAGCASFQQDKPGSLGDKVTQATPGADQLLLKSAEAFYKSKQYDEAVPIYNQILKQNPNQVQALYRLANVHFRKKDWETALTYYQRAIKNDPRHSRAQYNLAMTHLSLAEKHLKFFAATAPEGTDMSLASRIITFLNSLSEDPQSVADDALSNLADQFLAP